MTKFIERLVKKRLLMAVVFCISYAAPQATAQELARFAWYQKAVASGIDVAHKRARHCDASMMPIVEAGKVRRFDLLERMTGFARAAGTTGGLGKNIFLVTNLVDRVERGGHGPPGSLREALWQAKQAGGGWITVPDELPGDRRINLEFALFVPSNVTIDGGCRGLSISTPGHSVLVLPAVENIIITRLRLEHREGFERGRGDCIGAGDSDKIWIAFNTLRLCGDGLVDIGLRNYAPDRPIRATVAFNHFKDHEKDMLLATYDCTFNRTHAGCDGLLSQPWTWNGGVQVTLQGNLFDGTSQRHPKLAGQAYAHMVDNVIAFAPVERQPGKFGANYGSFAGAGSRLLAENNLYVALSGSTRAKAVIAQPGQSATRLDGNVVLGEASADEFNPEYVMRPPYALRKFVSWSDPPSAVACIASLVGPEGAGADRTACR